MEHLEQWLRAVASVAALSLELMTVLSALAGALGAVWEVLRSMAAGDKRSRRSIWLDFAQWILLSLEFALGADIIRTAIAPQWDDIGKLAAIAAIRTGLSWFLKRDIAMRSST